MINWKHAGAGLLALGTVVGAAPSAEAAQGCGPGFHRGFYGYCRPNLYRPFAYRPYGYYRPAFYGPRRWGWGPRVYRVGYARPGWGWHRAGWHHRW